jgi:hypothetical protein
VDPTGMDWFENNLTGEIYYNNTYAKNDLSKLKGEGWNWLGANDMFMTNGNRDNSDWYLVLQNGGKLSTNYNNPLTSIDDQIVLSLELKEHDAVSFMNSRGYEKKPLLADIYSFTKEINIPSDDGGIDCLDQGSYNSIEKIYSWTYAQKDAPSTWKILKTKYEKEPMPWYAQNWNIEHRWEKRLYQYNNSYTPSGETFFKIINYILDFILNSKGN